MGAQTDKAALESRDLTKEDDMGKDSRMSLKKAINLEKRKDMAWDKKHHIKEGSWQDKAIDAAAIKRAQRKK